MSLSNNFEIRPLFGESFPWKISEFEGSKGIGFDIDELTREAYEQGFKDGIAKGESKAKGLERIYKRTLNQLTTIIDELSNLRESIISKANRDITNLAILIARKIIKSEIGHNKGIILKNLKEAIKQITDGDKIVIKLNPKDYELIMNSNELKEILEIKNATFQKDRSILQGGCIVQTRFSEIDATIESQLNVIEQNLRV